MKNGSKTQKGKTKKYGRSLVDVGLQFADGAVEFIVTAEDGLGATLPNILDFVFKVAPYLLKCRS